MWRQEWFTSASLLCLKTLPPLNGKMAVVFHFYQHCASYGSYEFVCANNFTSDWNLEMSTDNTTEILGLKTDSFVQFLPFQGTSIDFLLAFKPNF